MADDSTMSLGEHLHELRRRLVRVILVLAVVMIGSFFLINDIQPLLLRPLLQAAAMVSDETVRLLGHESKESLTQLYNRGMTDGPFALLRISMCLAFTVAFPVLIWQVWGFVVPGLHANERKAGFLLVPTAVGFFYLGLLFGFFIGLPYLYKWIFEFNATYNYHVKLELVQGDYYDNFFMMSILFGAVMDIPWLVMVLVKARLVTPDKLAQFRKHIIFGAAVASAVLTPPDPFSQMMVLGMMVALFEIGLWSSRLIYGRRDAARAAADGAGVGADGLIGHMIDLPSAPPAAPVPLPTGPADDPGSAPVESLPAASEPTEAEPAEEGAVGVSSAEAPAAGQAPDPEVAPPADPWSQGRARKDLHRFGKPKSGRPGPRDGTADGPDAPDKG